MKRFVKNVDEGAGRRIFEKAKMGPFKVVLTGRLLAEGLHVKTFTGAEGDSGEPLGVANGGAPSKPQQS